MERLINKEKLGVFEETAQLKKVIMWGKPGPETIIAQILPKEISCFLEKFSVVGARKEFESVLTMIEKEGIQVIQVKDLYAKMIDDLRTEPRHSIDTLKEALIQKAMTFSKQYPSGYTGELELISDMIDEDCKKYGERAVIVMNERLSLDNKLPLANVLYARDQSNVAGETWIWSSMKYEIRQPEVSLYKEVLTHSGVVTPSNFKNIVSVNDNGKFEGGDGIANGGFYYVGIGGRTDWEGVKQIAESVLSQGLRLVGFRDKERASGRESEMEAMHLDTIWMPSDVNKIVSCQSQTQRRIAFEIGLNKNNKLIIKKSKSMDEHMHETGMQIIPLSPEEQEAFAPNFLNLGNNKVILSLVDSNSIDKQNGEKTIEEKLILEGKEVQNANLYNITRGYGGLHCMTAAIKRG